MDPAGELARRFDAAFRALAAADPVPPLPDVASTPLDELPPARAWGRRYREIVDAPALADAAFKRGYLLYLQQPAVAAQSSVLTELMTSRTMASTLQLLLANALQLSNSADDQTRRREGRQAAKRAHDSLLHYASEHRAKAMRAAAAAAPAPPPAPPPTPEPPAAEPKPPAPPAAVEVQPPLVSAPAAAPPSAFASAAAAGVPRFRASAKVLAMPPSAASVDAHRHHAALNMLLAQPSTQLVLWIAPPPRRMADGALLTGFVLRADRVLGTLGAARGEAWDAFFAAVDDAVAFHGGADGAQLSPGAQCWERRAMGGANVLLRVRRTDPPPVPPALREALIAPPIALLRAPLEQVRGSATSRQYAVEEMAALLDAGRSGFGVPVHAVVARGLTRPRKDGSVGSEARYKLLSVQALAAQGDLGRFFGNRAHPPTARAAALRGLRQTLFECSVRRYWLFDFRLENFVLFDAACAHCPLGAEVADVRCIDLDPDAFRRLHYQRPGDGDAWRPWLSDSGADADSGGDGDADAVAAQHGLVRCVGEGWRPVFLLNAVLVTAVLRHKLASEGLWRDAWWTWSVRQLLGELYQEVKADRALGARCNGFSGPDPARARPVDHEYAAAARVVACANWNASFDPDLTYVKREETHQPRDLGCIARDMLRFYTGAYLITEAEERIFRPLWDAHRNGTLVADPPPDSPVAAAFNFYDTNYRNHFYPCLCHFARKLRPPGPYAAHAAPPNLVDVVFAYADASAATLAAEGARDLCGRDRFIAEVLASPAALELGSGKERPRNRDRDRWLGVAGILHWVS